MSHGFFLNRAIISSSANRGMPVTRYDGHGLQTVQKADYIVFTKECLDILHLREHLKSNQDESETAPIKYGYCSGMGK